MEQPPLSQNRDDQGRILPGVSGNPAGRPRRIPKFVAEIRKDEPKYWKELARLALKADDDRTRLEALKTLLAYSRGKPRQSVELTGKDGGPVEVASTRDVLARLEELAKSPNVSTTEIPKK